MKWSLPIVLVLAGCGGDNQTQACPSQGVFVLKVSSDGKTPDVPGWPGLTESCDISSPGACAQQSMQLTLTLNGPASRGGDMVYYWSPATWSTGMDAGTCAKPEAGGYVSELGSVDGGSSYFPSCDFSVSCSDGIDQISLKMSAGGIYGHDIAAAVTIGGCCLVGSAVAQ